MLPKIFVINLKRSPERLAFMHKQLVDLGLDFEIIEAIDGKSYDFTNVYDEQLYKKHNAGTTITDSVKGCALSHRETMQRVLDENLEYALILEDDIELRNDFKAILIEELQKRKSGQTFWEYLSFNYPSVGWKSIHLWIFLFTEKIKRNWKSPFFLITIPIYLLKFIAISILYLSEAVRESLYIKIYRHGKSAFFYRPLYLAGCYLITCAGAKKLVEMNTPISYTADGLPNAARIKIGLKHCAYVPLVARQKREEFESTLYNDHFGKKVIAY